MSSLKDTVLAILEAHREQNIDKILAHHSDTCTWKVLPKSLGQAPLDNTAYKQMYEAIAPTFRSYQMTVNDIFVDEAGRKATVWMDATAETDAGPYVNEKMLIFYFDEAGKISRTAEFIDSAASAAFYAKLQAVIEGKANGI
ncbi:hypothetical protein B0H67DRAFT_553944 [Lasiosphaeris hirsuta]|uniref:SnoaL-like domain-containing protein n=1 Tax=Lasiosphaeris hirsuta TaxID=260670 RepID=A0AA40DXL7_9PEZI|nr:hypothetical protein B0H67DRAFT_553944 [Lasiosphaeris hirsuta]